MNATEAKAIAEAARQEAALLEAARLQRSNAEHAEQLQQQCDALAGMIRQSVLSAASEGRTETNIQLSETTLIAEAFTLVKPGFEADGYVVQASLETVDYGDWGAPCRIETRTITVSW